MDTENFVVYKEQVLILEVLDVNMSLYHVIITWPDHDIE